MARKKIKVQIDHEAYQRFRALTKNNLDLNGSINVLNTKLINKPPAEVEINFEVTGMMTYDLWDKLCRVFNQRILYPG